MFFYCCSSRFTDSKKYEDDFMDCFQLHERRSGEICNACVLLVKRWKKLPAGSERNWRHVSVVLIITLENQFCLSPLEHMHLYLCALQMYRELF